MAHSSLVSAFSSAAATRQSSTDLDPSARYGTECEDVGGQRNSMERASSVERRRWQSAITRVSRANSFSKSFKTLRDMSGECYIDNSRLKRLKELGTGAFATVSLYELSTADAQGPPARVAVKRIHPQLLRSQRELEAFAGEAKLLRKLQHKYIVRFIGVGGDMDCVAGAAMLEKQGLSVNTLIIQEHLNGGTLKKLLFAQMTSTRPGRPVYTHTQALTWMRQVAEGLHYLHSANPRVIHRDLKLENVLMRQSCKLMGIQVEPSTGLPSGERQACLVDFGLSALVQQHDAKARQCQQLQDAGAKAHDGLQRLTNDLDARLKRSDSTHTQLISGSKAPEATFHLTGRTGSLFYMAPELVLSQPYNEKVDVFALAMIMQEVFSGIITSAIVVGPTLDPRAAEVYAYKVAQGYRRPLPDKWPGPLCLLIQDAWAEKAEDRPSMAECLQRLKAMEADHVFAGEKQVAASTCCCMM